MQTSGRSFKKDVACIKLRTADSSRYPPRIIPTKSKKSDNIRGVEPRGNESKRPVKPDVQQSAADEARNTVRSAVESNPVLSNLFGKNKSSVTEKERRDALFTRDC